MEAQSIIDFYEEANTFLSVLELDNDDMGKRVRTLMDHQIKLMELLKKPFSSEKSEKLISNISKNYKQLQELLDMSASSQYENSLELEKYATMHDLYEDQIKALAEIN